MRRSAIAALGALLTLFGAACSDDGDTRKSAAPGPVSVYNSTAKDSVEADCACFAAELGFSDTQACLDARFDPLVLSSCEEEAVRCEATDFEIYLSCQRAAQTEFQACIEGCPADPQSCRDALEDAVADCDEARSAELLAHFQTCRSGGSPVCSDPQFPGDPDAGGTDSDGGGPGSDAGMPDDMGTEENRAPSADAGTDQSVLPGVAVALQGSGTDPDGDALSFSWAIVEQPAQSSPVLTNAQQATATLTANTSGEYTVELTVDDGSLTDADQVVVTVTEVDQPPTAVAGSPGVVEIGTLVALDASASSDDVDSLNDLTFSWSFIADPSGGSDTISNANTYTASFTPSSAGTYEAQVRVTDTAGNLDTDTVLISVVDGPCVIISEYIEGSGENRAVEIYNCGASNVDLGRVGFCTEANDDSLAVDGCTVQTELGGLLAPNDVYVLCHTNFGSPALCDQFYFGVAFTGDDRFVIYYDDDNDDSFTYGNDTILDAFGRLAQRPGDSTIWRDKGLRRCNFTPFDGMSAFVLSDYYVEAPFTDFSMLGDPPVETCSP